MVDVGVEHVFIAVMLIAPDLVEQVEPRKKLPRMACKKIQQVEFTGGELNRLAVHLYRTFQRVDAEVAKIDAARTCTRNARHGVRAPQQRTHTRHQFQPQDTVYFAGAGAADDDDGRVARDRAGTPENLETIDAWKHDIEHHGIPATALQFTQARMPVSGMDHRETFVAQVHSQEFGDVGVVLDDQNAFGKVHGRKLSRHPRF